VNNGRATQVASLQDKQIEYDHIAKQQKGRVASWYRQYAKLVMTKTEIDRLTQQHIADFYQYLVNIYKKTKGYPEDFDRFPQKVQLALFDMVFNLGPRRLIIIFPLLDNCIKAGDWQGAALQCHRPQVSVARNQYVMQLFLSAAREEALA
jgi:GH24 family phage-related lysozyme (muramidase)